MWCQIANRRFAALGWAVIVFIACGYAVGCDCGDDDDDDHGPGGVDDDDDNDDLSVAGRCTTTVSHEGGAYDVPFRVSLATDCEGVIHYKRECPGDCGEEDFRESAGPVYNLAIDRDTTLRFYSVSPRGLEEEERAVEYRLPPRFDGISFAHSGDNQVVLQWRPALDLQTPVTYRIYQPHGDEPIEALTPIFETADTEVTVDDAITTVANGTSVCFVVRARDADGAEDLNLIERCFYPAPVLYVDAAAAPGGDGSMATPFQSLQAANDALPADRTVTNVYVAGGVYEESLDFANNDPPYTDHARAAQVFGGFDAANAWQRDVEGQPTIVAGDGAAPVWRVGEGDFVEGFAVMGGGDGFVMDNVISAAVVNCIAIDNTGIGVSVAADDLVSGPSLINLVVARNGTGIALAGYPDNDSDSGVNALLRNVIVYGNAGVGIGGTATGGGAYTVTLGARVRNVIAAENGLGIAAAISGANVAASFTVFNSYVGGNQTDLACNGCEDGALFLSYCDIRDPGAFTGDALLNVEPEFVDPPRDFHLMESSPLVDAGSPDPYFNDVDSTRNDIGAFGGLGSAWSPLIYDWWE